MILLKKTAYSLLIILIACVLTGMVGCATVDSGPFTKFDNATKEASTGIVTAMSVNYDWTRSGFIASFSTSPESKFSELIIQPDKKYTWTMEKPPVYLAIEKARAALNELNNSFVQYADLLVKLSGRELVSTDKFDQMAKDLNKNAKDAMAALKMQAAPTEVALFSTAASEAARLYIEHKRQDYLIETLQKNQDSVQKYSDTCIELIRTITGDMKTYYVEKYEPIRIAWNASSGENRQKQTEAMLTLNEQFVNALGVLQELEASYDAIPRAHADLSKSIKSPKLDLEGIQELYSSGKRLQELYAELKKT